MRANRVDANHSQIKNSFEALGYSVKDVSMVKGFVDLCVGQWGKTLLVEVKDGTKPPSARKLTPAEQNFHDTWQGNIWIVTSVDDVIQIDGELRRERNDR